MIHYEFISQTDKKSLFNQIKYLVNCAQESYSNDLSARRKHLKEMFDSEEKIYENEFVGKIKSRVDMNIRERQESLLAMKQERTKEIEKFVAAKKLHQNMTNCYEIREELRKKDYRETQICQLEQMDDNLRAKAQAKKDDEFWLNVQQRITDKYDERQRREELAKKALQCNQCKILDKQLDEHRRMREMDLEHSQQEKRAADLRMKEANRREKEAALKKRIARNIESKQALNTVCGQKQLLEKEAETFEEVFHDETMRQVKIEMERELRKNQGVREATLDYLAFVKKFKQFSAEQDQRRDEISDELAKRFICYKNHPKHGIALRKRQVAESTHKVLLKQICEEQARKVQLEAQEKENKILENRFSRLEVRDKVKEREKIKSGLDLQLKELARLNEEKQKQFAQELNRAEQDQIYCEKLLERHLADGCDYLPPHPNWKLLACYKPPCKSGGGGGDAK